MPGKCSQKVCLRLAENTRFLGVDSNYSKDPGILDDGCRHSGMGSAIRYFHAAY